MVGNIVVWVGNFVVGVGNFGLGLHLFLKLILFVPPTLYYHCQLQFQSQEPLYLPALLLESQEYHILVYPPPKHSYYPGF